MACGSESLTERHMGGGRASGSESTIYNAHKGELLPACSVTEGNRFCQVMAFNTKRVLLAEGKKTQKAMA